MPSTVPHQPDHPAGDSPQAIPELREWRVFLARRQPGRAAAAVALCLGAAAWAWYYFGSPLPALATLFLLLAAVGEFLFPVRYRLDEAGAEAKSPFYWRRILWKEVKQVYSGEEEIKLSPLRHPSPREAFRGVLLRCPDNRDEVLATVRKLRDAAA